MSDANREMDEVDLLPQTGPNTEMGRLLRSFWHPVGQSNKLEIGKTLPIRVFSEDLTLYRGDSGAAHLVDGRCAHRKTLLHTGWVQGEQIRCMYHGWCYDGTGRCTEMPAEKSGLPETVKIAGYPVYEYCGLIFAYLGDGAAPEFDLPRKDVFERSDRLYFTRDQTWPCNWFQQIENSMDAAHVSFVHQKGRVGRFGEAVTPAIPDLEYTETDAGMRQIATRGENNVRISDWAYPNNNHIILPSWRKDFPWLDLSIWMVPADDENTIRFQLYSIPSGGAEEDRIVLEHFAKYAGYNPAHHHDELFYDEKYPEESLLELTNAQDYVAAVGQGAIVDRKTERLGRSDAGVAMLRRIFLRELAALRGGRAPKHWKKLDHAEDLPIQAPRAASG